MSYSNVTTQFAIDRYEFRSFQFVPIRRVIEGPKALRY